MENGLGFAAHTPLDSIKQQLSNPQASKLQVFSRKRYHKQKLQLGCTDDSNTIINKDTKSINPSPTNQQHEFHDKCESAQGQIIDIRQAQQDQEETENANNQKQEAEALWTVAKALGVTDGSSQQNFVNKLMEMEERDKKEARRLGSKKGLQWTLSHTMSEGSGGGWNGQK